MNVDIKKAKNLSKLSKSEIAILLHGETEPPFSGKLLNNKQNGRYQCKACGQQLFSSETKYDSKSGWPSFDQALPGSISEVPDNSYGMNRTEIRCSNCGAHLGHLFNDGPSNTTGLRYCINSSSLDFNPKLQSK